VGVHRSGVGRDGEEEGGGGTSGVTCDWGKGGVHAWVYRCAVWASGRVMSSHGDGNVRREGVGGPCAQAKPLVHKPHSPRTKPNPRPLSCPHVHVKYGRRDMHPGDRVMSEVRGRAKGGGGGVCVSQHRTIETLLHVTVTILSSRGGGEGVRTEATGHKPRTPVTLVPRLHTPTRGTEVHMAAMALLIALNAVSGRMYSVVPEAKSTQSIM
jgi:hypothetical protein